MLHRRLDTSRTRPDQPAASDLSARLRQVTYFFVPHPDRIRERTLATQERLVTKTEELVADMASRGRDPLTFGVDIDKVRRDRDKLREQVEAEKAEGRAALDGIREQAVADAQAAWDRGDAYFAPVLFQPMARDGGGWEVALQEITEFGWRLDSWQVIGPAPAPFMATVTLIQTLLTR